jgi:hypothetical protein
LQLLVRENLGLIRRGMHRRKHGLCGTSPEGCEKSCNVKQAYIEQTHTLWTPPEIINQHWASSSCGYTHATCRWHMHMHAWIHTYTDVHTCPCIHIQHLHTVGHMKVYNYIWHMHMHARIRYNLTAAAIRSIRMHLHILYSRRIIHIHTQCVCFIPCMLYAYRGIGSRISNPGTCPWKPSKSRRYLGTVAEWIRTHKIPRNQRTMCVSTH